MRIITGSLKGRRFEIPKGLDVRPTTDRTKESMFNNIEAYKYIEGTRVLDLFAPNVVVVVNVVVVLNAVVVPCVVA